MLHPGKAEAVAGGRRLAERLGERGITVAALAADAERLGPAAAAVDELPQDLDLVFVFGGDGTLLRAAEMVGGGKTPLLGVNVGHLGFLTSLERGDLEAGLERILSDGIDVEERMVLEATVEGTDVHVRALNDVIVEKARAGRAIRLALAVGGEELVSWAADGVIVATATGSTAYSFSVGGPVVSPRLDCIVITPVAPHGLFGRTMIAPPDEPVEMTLLPDADPASLSADGGPGTPLDPGARVVVRASPDRIRLARVQPQPFWSLVREKFDLDPGRR